MQNDAESVNSLALFRNGQKWVTLARQSRPSPEMTSPEFIAFPKLF